ncbi:MAG: gliding motility-associated C-terminal domain-containing protein [Flavobacteriales bacterium]|nr:gliding motility-associated C-terminal domain-containing protein [Flavobacteriales bacterium]MCB9168373.1 gliding motility-associated C-terminal domain-containing protein [Flavobacteriales bacterium]
MRHTLALLLCADAVGHLIAQNLVPNPSFEQVTSCPSFASQLDHATPWTNPTLGTPELYHGCAPLSSYVSVPFNTTGGFQYARTGQGYAGLYTWRTDIPNMREYAEVQLLSPLQAGTCYRVTMYVNMPNDHPYACDGFGAHFSTNPIGASNGQVLPYPAHVENPTGQLLTDTAGWTMISGVYTAAGGEQYLTIGNFRNDAATQTLQVNSGTWYTTSAYLLVDDVSVEPLVLDLDLGPDTLLCTTDQLLLDATTPGATYLWSDGSTGPTLLAAHAGTYWARVSIGGCSVSDTLVITGGGPPEVDLPRDVFLCPGATTVLDATFPGSTVLWSDGDTSAARVVEMPGVYAVTVTNACGSRHAEAEVHAEICACIPYLPNAFTPNGDGINDRVHPLFRCAGGAVRWAVYDRWGSLAFDAEDGSMEWDGTIGGVPVPAGVYVWQAHVQGTANDDGLYMGHVMLIR